MTAVDHSSSLHSSYVEVDVIIQYRGETARRIMDVHPDGRHGLHTERWQEEVLRALRSLNLVIASGLPTRWDLQWDRALVRLSWRLARQRVRELPIQLSSFLHWTPC